MATLLPHTVRPQPRPVWPAMQAQLVRETLHQCKWRALLGVRLCRWGRRVVSELGCRGCVWNLRCVLRRGLQLCSGGAIAATATSIAIAAAATAAAIAIAATSTATAIGATATAISIAAASATPVVAATPDQLL